MSYYVVRSDNDLAHHGVLGMKWGVWNDETRARRTGFRAQKKKKYDYSDLSDADLQKKLNRKRNEDQLRQLEKKDEPKTKIQMTEDGLKAIRNVLAISAAITASAIVLKKNTPEVVSAFRSIVNKCKDVKMSTLNSNVPEFMDPKMLRTTRRYMDLTKLREVYGIENWDEILKYI